MIWRTSLKIIRNYGVALLAGVIFAQFMIHVWGVLSGDTYLLDGNIHDFFIPWNAALAVKQGMEIHVDFHSPFGPVYFFLSSNALRLIESYPSVLQLPDIHYLSSLIFGGALTLVFLVVRACQPRGTRIPFWVLVLLLLLCFQARDIDRLDHAVSNWYGIYNSQLWSLVLFQIAVVLHWQEQPKSRASTIILALVQVFCLLVAFHYKISFFAASGLVVILPVFFLGSLSRVGLYIGLGVAICGVVVAVISLFGFSYTGYLQDIALAAASKASGSDSEDNGDLLRALVAFVLLAQFLRNHNRQFWDPETPFLERFRHYVVEGHLKCIKGKEVVFDGLVSLALGFAALGDFNRPIIPLAFVLSFYVFTRAFGGRFLQRSRWSALHLVVLYLLFAFVGIALESTRVVAEGAQNADGNDAMSYQKWQVAYLDYPSAPFAFRFRRELTVSEFVDRGPLTRGPQWDQELINFSLEGYDEIEGPKNRPLPLKASLVPGAGSHAQYLDDLNGTLKWFEDNGLIGRQSLSVAGLGFANPWPLLTRNSIPKSSQHWMHLGTTLPFNDYSALLDGMAAADVVVMPLLSVDEPMQWRFNCAFTLWNAGEGTIFEPLAVVGLNLILAKSEIALKISSPISAQWRAPLKITDTGQCNEFSNE